jgi:hypothetical protein
MNFEALEKIFGAAMTRKIEHAKQFVKPDDTILEFSLQVSAGNFSGFLNTLLEDKTRQSVLLSFKDVEKCKNFKEMADAKYEIVSDPAKLSFEYTAVFVVEENEENLHALIDYLKNNSPRLVVWEWKNANIHSKLHEALHAQLKAQGYFPHVVGYENVYLDYAPEKVKGVDNPPLPNISHYVYSLVLLLVFVFIMYSLSRYFFCTITPTVKSLAKRPM